MPSSRTRVRHSRGRTNSPAAAAAAAGGEGPDSREKHFAKKFVPPASPPKSSASRHHQQTQTQSGSRGRHAPLQRRHSTDPQSSSLAVERAQARAAAALGQRPSLRGVKALEAAERISADSRQSRSPPSFRSSAVGPGFADDGDGGGRDNYVDLVGFRTRCRDLDLQLAPEEEREVFRELDRDGSGFVDFGDFIHGVAKKASGVQAHFRRSLREQKLAERHARSQANAQAVEVC